MITLHCLLYAQSVPSTAEVELHAIVRAGGKKNVLMTHNRILESIFLFIPLNEFQTVHFVRNMLKMGAGIA
jgi:hypothetical protein